MDQNFKAAAEMFAKNDTGLQELIDLCRETGETPMVFLYQEGYYLVFPNQYDYPPQNGMALIVQIKPMYKNNSLDLIKTKQRFWESFNHI